MYLYLIEDLLFCKFILENWQNLIKKALKHVENKTCMHFVPNVNSKDYLQFIRGSGCYSSVGRVLGRQQVSIGFGCDSVSTYTCYIRQNKIFNTDTDFR